MLRGYWRRDLLLGGQCLVITNGGREEASPSAGVASPPSVVLIIPIRGVTQIQPSSTARFVGLVFELLRNGWVVAVGGLIEDVVFDDPTVPIHYLFVGDPLETPVNVLLHPLRVHAHRLVRGLLSPDLGDEEAVLVDELAD